MTPDYASLYSCSCSETNSAGSEKRLYFKYPYTSTTSPCLLAILPASAVVPQKKNKDKFSMIVSERSFADIWNDPQEDVWDKL